MSDNPIFNSLIGHHGSLRSKEEDDLSKKSRDPDQ
jgi:hypothetical protein